MIPFLDLRKQYEPIAEELEAAVLDVLRSQQYILGEPVERFEEDFARYCGTRHSVAVSSGTAALQIALAAMDIGPGDEVITVPATFVATVSAILYVGATPVLADIDPVTWTMDPAGLEALITPRTRAIIPVHLHGRLADMAAIGAIAARHGIPVIEDAAQAHGATRGLRAGNFGAIGCFSFFPGKNIGACGEGGAVTTNDDALAEKMRSLRDWGQLGKQNHVYFGYNYRMDAIQGAVLRVKLRHLDGWLDGRRRVANAYDAALPGWLDRAAGPFGMDHACHVYAIRADDRLRLQADLASVGIPTNIHYLRPVHLQPAFSHLGYGPGDLPVAEGYAATTLSLPIFPELTDDEVAMIASAVADFTSVRAEAVA